MKMFTLRSDAQGVLVMNGLRRPPLLSDDDYSIG